MTAQEALASSAKLCVLLEVAVLQVRARPSCGDVGIPGSGVVLKVFRKSLCCSAVHSHEQRNWGCKMVSEELQLRDY